MTEFDKIYPFRLIRSRPFVALHASTFTVGPIIAGLFLLPPPSRSYFLFFFFRFIGFVGSRDLEDLLPSSFQEASLLRNAELMHLMRV